MHKKEFLDALQLQLSGLPRQEIEEGMNFYSEMIDDRMEEGYTEEEAVSKIGPVDDIAAQIISDISFAKIARERLKPKKRFKAWEIVLLVLGSPIWLSLAIAVLAVILSLYISLWSVLVSVWAVFGALAGCTFGGVIMSASFAINGNALTGLAVLGAAFVCVGLSIFMLFGCKAATKGIVLLTKKMALGIKKCFAKREEL